MSGEKEFFSQMVVDAVKCLDPHTLDLALLGMKKVCVNITWLDIYLTVTVPAGMYIYQQQP